MQAHRRGSKALLIIGGGIFLLALLIMVVRMSFHSSALSANGVVDKINRDEATIRVRFTPKSKGDHYLTLEGSSWVRRSHKGDGMVVVYQASDPNNARLGTNFPYWLLPVFLWLLSMVFIVGSRRWSAWIEHEEYLENRIWKEGGVRITNFERIEKDRSISTPEQGKWRLVSSWTDQRTYEVIEFKSKPRDFYPDELLIPKLIKVTIHPDDDNARYEFDPKVMDNLQPSPD